MNREGGLPRANSNYSNAQSVRSNGLNINLTPFEEILSYIESCIENFKEKLQKDSTSAIAKITDTLSDEALSVFEKCEDRKMNTAIGYLKEVRNKLSEDGGKVLKHLKYIRKMLAYILYRALPDYIKPPPKDGDKGEDEDGGASAGAGAGAGSKGGYRRRRSKKVKRSRRRLTHRR